MPAHHPTLTLYTKPGCCLCDQLKDDLAWLGQEFPFALVECDISRVAAGEGASEEGDGDADGAGLTPAQIARLRNYVPVLAINDVLYYPPHDLLELRTALAQAGRPPGS